MTKPFLNADQLVAAEILPNVRNRFQAYEFARRNPDCVFRDGRAVLFKTRKILELADSAPSDQTGAA